MEGNANYDYDFRILRLHLLGIRILNNFARMF